MRKSTLRPPPTVPDRGPAPRRRRARALSIAGRTLATLGLAATFVVSLGVGVVLHVNLPASRRVAADLLSRSLTARNPVRVLGDTAGAYILPQTINNARTFDLGVSVDPSMIARRRP